MIRPQPTPFGRNERSTTTGAIMPLPNMPTGSTNKDPPSGRSTTNSIERCLPHQPMHKVSETSFDQGKEPISGNAQRRKSADSRVDSVPEKSTKAAPHPQVRQFAITRTKTCGLILEPSKLRSLAETETGRDAQMTPVKSESRPGTTETEKWLQSVEPMQVGLPRIDVDQSSAMVINVEPTTPDEAEVAFSYDVEPSNADSGTLDASYGRSTSNLTAGTLQSAGLLTPDAYSTASGQEDPERPATRISFIMRERLRSLAVDIHRRTTQMKEHVQQPPTPEMSETASLADEGETEQRRRSLKSFVGNTSPVRSIDTPIPQDTTDVPVVPFWKRAAKRLTESKLFTKSIDRQKTSYFVWLAIVSTCFLYNAYGIPLRSSYPYQTANNLVYWLLFDYLADFVYLADTILIKPRIRYIKAGLPVKNFKDTRKHYLKSIQFKFDAISLLPLDIFYVVTGIKPMLRIFRVFKIMTYWEFFHFVDSIATNPFILRIAKTLAYMIYIVHCNSCIYYVISAKQAFGLIGYWTDGTWKLNNWVYNNSGTAYIRCFYFTTKLATSIGNNPPPTNVVEYIYVTISWLMGVFVFALLLGQIRDIVATASRNRDEFRTTMDKALQHCQKLKLPQELQDKVRDWFIYTWQQQKALDENQLIAKLPLKLQTDLAISVHYQTLGKVQLFQDADRALLRELVLKFKPVLFLPGDYVCKKGEVGKEMYIVTKGLLEVVGGPEGRTVFATLKEGSVFGEVALLNLVGSNKRTADVKSKGFSNLFILSKIDLYESIKDYPNTQKLLKRKAKKLLQKKNEDKTKEEAEENLRRMAAVSSQIPPAKMLSAVMNIMDPNATTVKQLQSVLNPAQQRKLSKAAMDSELASVADELMLDPQTLQDELDILEQQAREGIPVHPDASLLSAPGSSNSPSIRRLRSSRSDDSAEFADDVEHEIKITTDSPESENSREEPPTVAIVTVTEEGGSDN